MNSKSIRSRFYCPMDALAHVDLSFVHHALWVWGIPPVAAPISEKFWASAPQAPKKETRHWPRRRKAAPEGRLGKVQRSRGPAYALCHLPTLSGQGAGRSRVRAPGGPGVCLEFPEWQSQTHSTPPLSIGRADERARTKAKSKGCFFSFFFLKLSIKFKVSSQATARIQESGT